MKSCQRCTPDKKCGTHRPCPTGCTCGRHQRRKGPEELSYSGRHARVRATRGKASDYQCELCDLPAREWSQTHETDGTDPTHYRPLCFKCHRDYDGTTEMMWEACRGVPRPEHVKKAVGASARTRKGMKRAPMTDATKAKISKTRKERGRGASADFMRELSANNKGKKLSPETRERMRLAALERWRRKREAQ